MTAAPTFDLQSHSVHSDGALPPGEVVRAAAEAGVELFALSDHDTTDGVAEAAAAGSQAGVALVSAVEISALYEGRQDLHILGYLIDPADRGLVEALERSRNDREHRAQRMVEALTGLGFAVDEALLAERRAGGRSIGRPHLAEAVVARPENRARLERERLAGPEDVLVAYLIEGRPAFVARAAPSVEEAIGLIHGAGGVAVWAHPFWDVAAPAEVLDAARRFERAGLDGIEAFYVTHTEEQTRLLAEHCAQAGLLSTGSSDFHGPAHQTFSAFRAFRTYGLQPRLGPLDG